MWTQGGPERARNWLHVTQESLSQLLELNWGLLTPKMEFFLPHCPAIPRLTPSMQEWHCPLDYTVYCLSLCVCLQLLPKPLQAPGYETSSFNDTLPLFWEL